MATTTRKYKVKCILKVTPPSARTPPDFSSASIVLFHSPAGPTSSASFVTAKHSTGGDFAFEPKLDAQTQCVVIFPTVLVIAQQTYFLQTASQVGFVVDADKSFEATYTSGATTSTPTTDPTVQNLRDKITKNAADFIDWERLVNVKKSNTTPGSETDKKADAVTAAIADERKLHDTILAGLGNNPRADQLRDWANQLTDKHEFGLACRNILQRA